MSIRRHTIYSLIGQLVPMLVALATIPLYLRLIGEVRYGVLAMVWLLVGYCGLFDLGLGQAVAQRLALKNDRSPRERGAVVGSALIIASALAVAGSAVAWLIGALFFGELLSVPVELQRELRLVLPWIALAVPLAAWTSVLNGALQARERFLALNVVSACSAVAMHVLPVAAAFTGAVHLAILVPAALAGRALALLALGWQCRIHVTEGSGIVWTTRHVAGLVRFGRSVTVSAIVGPMMVVMDRFAIGAWIGAKSVGQYVVPFHLAERMTMLPFSLSQALFPRMAAMGASQQQELARTSYVALSVLMTPVAAAGVLLIEPFLTWWISQELAEASARAGQLLFVGFWINGLAFVPLTKLYASGRPDVVAKCHLVELVPYWLILFCAMDAWGLAGAALAFSVRAAVDFLLLAYFAADLPPATRTLRWPSFLLVSIAVVAVPGAVGAQWRLAGGTALVFATLLWGWRAAPKPWRDALVASRPWRRGAEVRPTDDP